MKRPGFALTLGTLGHEILDRCYKRITSGKIEGVPDDDDVGKAIDQALDKWYDQNPTHSNKAAEDAEKAANILDAIMPYYFDYWEEDLETIKWERLEGWFKYHFKVSGDVRIPINGKWDGIYRAGKKDKLYLFESKFMGQVNEGNLIDHTPMSLQNNIYLLAMEHEFEETPAGVTYNIIRKPQLRQRKDESDDEFVKRISEDVEKRPDFYFIRFQIDADADEMNRARSELQGVLNDFFHWWKGDRMDYRNTTMCLNIYGRCDYLNICAMNDWSNFYRRKPR